MATVVCQGLQSCLQESRTLRLKLSSSRPHFSNNPLEFSLKPSFLDSNPKEVIEGKRFHHEENTRKTSNSSTNLVENGGWSFLQSLPIAQEKETIYVHPMTKRSLYNLSEKSLELCTENLGNETGSDIVISVGLWNWGVTDIKENVLSPSSPETDTCGMIHSLVREEMKKNRQLSRVKKVKARDIHFPPPLTTLSGPDVVRVKAYREDGRLVMKAEKVPSQGSVFHAERKNGRLQLSLLKDYICDTQSHIKRDNFSPCCFDLEEEEGDDGNGVGEVGIDQLQRPSKCNEGAHDQKGVILNLESFRVATQHKILSAFV